MHILKSVLSISEVSKTSTDKKAEGNSVHRALTKKEMWAEKEAKSLGVGELYGSVESALTSQQQQWQAFVLLYEMLDEYGTHLVEAVWSNQVRTFFSFGNCNFFLRLMLHCFVSSAH